MFRGSSSVLQPGSSTKYLQDQCAVAVDERSPFTGESMKLSISYKHVESQEEVVKDVEKHVAKLNKFLQAYAPDLVQLHGVFAENAHKEEHSCTLNLSLPTGLLHATGIGKNPRASCKKAFSELESQVKKHQALLRKDYQWKRKRSRESALVTP
jgi:ribosome-associated translation inhibitor RaiA